MAAAMETVEATPSEREAYEAERQFLIAEMARGLDELASTLAQLNANVARLVDRGVPLDRLSEHWAVFHSTVASEVRDMAAAAARLSEPAAAAEAEVAAADRR